MKSKLIISLLQTVKLSLKISLFIGVGMFRIFGREGGGGGGGGGGG